MGDFMDIGKLKVVMEAEKYMLGENKSEIFRKYGIARKATDYATQLIKSRYSNNIEYYIGTSDDDFSIRLKGVEYCSSYIVDYNMFWRFGICPIIDYSEIDLKVLDLTRNSDGMLEATFGFLPNEK